MIQSTLIIGMMRKRKKHNMGSNNRQPSFSGLIRHILLLAAIFYLGIHTYTICMFHHQTNSDVSGKDDYWDGSPPLSSEQQQHHEQRLNKTEPQRVERQFDSDCA